MIVVPALFRGVEDVESLLDQLELHYLSNPDPHLGFALLADFADAPRANMVDDGPIADRAKSGLRELNRRHGRDSFAPFYVFLRERRWNPSEGVWMGWERKRGKLEEFNRLLLGSGPTSFTVSDGDLSVLSKIRYVLTADADTGLPRGSAARLIGTLAHPLNRPRVEPESRRVVAGYTVLQPRVEITAVSANQSPFSRIFSGDTGLDLYPRAVSDVYQDLFGEGMYVGKGLYDLEGFHQTLAEVVPENTVLSHDLLEGVHGRVALVTDITLLEDYPSAYLPWASRQHRWIRGDWQLLPWLFSGLFRKGSARSLPAIQRWKIADNLRRSLLCPALLAWLVAAWLWLPGSALLWTLLAALTPEVPAVDGGRTGDRGEGPPQILDRTGPCFASARPALAPPTRGSALRGVSRTGRDRPHPVSHAGHAASPPRVDDRRAHCRDVRNQARLSPHLVPHGGGAGVRAECSRGPSRRPSPSPTSPPLLFSWLG